MKRYVEPENSEARGKMPRRQDPVSCQFCRKKKLKCDRTNPCSNCRARRLTCSNTLDNKEGSTLTVNESPRNVDGSSSSETIEQLTARLKNLEELLAAKSPSSPNNAPQSSSRAASSASKIESRENGEATKTMTWIETDAFEQVPAPLDDGAVAATKVAESFGSFIFSLTSKRVTSALDQEIRTVLPTRSQGQTLLNYYFDQVNWIYHIVHVPTVRNNFDNLYKSIEENKPLEYGHLSLIFTMYALSAYFSSSSSGLYLKHSESMSYSRCWTTIAQDCLAASNFLVKPTLEGIQSLILISQLLMPNIGALAALRTFAITITNAARSMGLHEIDAPWTKRLRENTHVDYVELEVKRRIWWHITSTDWLLAFMSGSQCGTYTIHPRHMIVDYPSNVNDADINSTGDYAQPEDIPTEMTYIIFRIKGSIMFRNLVDAIWDSGSNADEMSYELLLEFDKKFHDSMIDFEQVYNNIGRIIPPNKLKNPPCQDVSPRMISILKIQQQLAHFAIHCRFSRLHRPYLVRGSRDPRYAYSRMVCLRSSRTVIEIGKSLMALDKSMDSMKIWSLNHHMFVSTTILVMDYCFNREEPRAKERMEEILDCFQVLESCKGESTMATRGIEKLKGLLNEASTVKYRESIGGTLPAASIKAAPIKESPSMQYTQVSGDQEPTSQAQPIMPSYEAGNNISGFTFNDSLPQYTWPEFGYGSMQNLNFDVDFDPSQFEVFFADIDSNRLF